MERGRERESEHGGGEGGGGGVVERASKRQQFQSEFSVFSVLAFGTRWCVCVYVFFLSPFFLSFSSSEYRIYDDASFDYFIHSIISLLFY